MSLLRLISIKMTEATQEVGMQQAVGAVGAKLGGGTGDILVNVEEGHGLRETWLTLLSDLD